MEVRRINIDISDMFNTDDIIHQSVLTNGSVFGQLLPSIIAHKIGGDVVSGPRGKKYVKSKKTGTVYKVWLGCKGKFDVRPSYSKGAGRDDLDSHEVDRNIIAVSDRSKDLHITLIEGAESYEQIESILHTRKHSFNLNKGDKRVVSRG